MNPNDRKMLYREQKRLRLINLAYQDVEKTLFVLHQSLKPTLAGNTIWKKVIGVGEAQHPLREESLIAHQLQLSELYHPTDTDKGGDNRRKYRKSC